VYVADTANNRISAISRSPISNVAFSSEDGEIYGNDTKIKIETDTNASLPVIETSNATETGNAAGTAATGDNGGTITPTNRVSIIPGSSTLTDTAYQPNPAQVSVGDTITWTNDDSTAHTVTSGQNGQSDGRFDSSIMAPQQTFEHTFTEGVGDYPYFCLLHPNMVGTVSVVS
jgi:plastocyanin